MELRKLNEINDRNSQKYRSISLNIFDIRLTSLLIFKTRSQGLKFILDVPGVKCTIILLFGMFKQVLDILNSFEVI